MIGHRFLSFIVLLLCAACYPDLTFLTFSFASLNSAADAEAVVAPKRLRRNREHKIPSTPPDQH